ncbi:MAG: DUF6471 domain-containing protein [Oleiphilaceae bacterium]|nr:DUF6471 domain-containing protein [Oleiphilaceae bacterium]
MSPSKSQTEWREVVSRFIKSEMTKRKIKYDDLSQLLQAKGTDQTSANLRNKINRGIMGAELFLQILTVLDSKEIDMSTIKEIADAIAASR